MAPDPPKPEPYAPSIGALPGVQGGQGMPAPSGPVNSDVKRILGADQIPPPPPPPAPDATPPANNDGGGQNQGAGKIADIDRKAAQIVDNSAANSQAGYNGSQGNLDQLRTEIERLAPIADTPEGRQQIMELLQRYADAGGTQLKASDANAQQNSGQLDDLIAQLKDGDGGKKHSSDDSKDDKHKSDDDSSSDKKSDDATDKIKGLVDSLPQALQSALGQNPMNQNPLGMGQNPMGGMGGQQNPFGTPGSAFGPNSNGTQPISASDPFSNIPGTKPGGTPGAGGGGSTTPGSNNPFDVLKTGNETTEGKDEEGKDDSGGKKVKMPDGTEVEAPTKEAADALRASLKNDGSDTGFDKNNPGVLIENPEDVKPGDRAVWDDHSNVAYGPGKVVNNGQVVDVNTLTNPEEGFKGWYRDSGEGGGTNTSSTSGTATSTAAGTK
ncbi:Biofilm regulator BssS [Mycobacteroides abscessus subsp. abscessus]|nr:Biofilm regulator BssS [Mycobacteroides abscessus subsp. abscessus]